MPWWVQRYTVAIVDPRMKLTNRERKIAGRSIELVGPSESSATLRWHDRRPGRGSADWDYVRVLQNNNQMAWSSPVFIQ